MIKEVDPQILALRRKPLGNAALEVLLALNDQKLEFITASWPRNPEFFDVHLICPQNLKNSGKGVLQVTTISRKTSVIDALIKREYVSAQPIENYFSAILAKAAESSEKDYLRVKEQIKNLKNSFWKIERSNYLVQQWTINDAGRKALKEMSARINLLQIQAPKYVASVRLGGDDMITWGVGGIYRILKESKDRVFITKEKIQGIPDFEKDRTVKTVYSQGVAVGDYIEKDNILLSDIQIDEYLRLYQITLTFKEAVQLEREQTRARIESIHNQSEEKIDGMCNQVQSLFTDFKNNWEANKTADQEEDGFILDLETEDLVEMKM